MNKWMVIGIAVAAIAGIGYYLWKRGKAVAGYVEMEQETTLVDGISEAELEQARYEATFGNPAVDWNLDALDKLIAQRTPEQQAFVDRVAVAQYRAGQDAVALGATQEQKEMARRAAGLATFRDIPIEEAIAILENMYSSIREKSSSYYTIPISLS